MAIPKKIFQTHKSFEYIQSKPHILNAVNSWKQYTDFEYHFYSNEMCEEFIRAHFDENVFKAYMRCPMAVMKADLWRYCVIYIHGGIYADTDTVCMEHPNMFRKDDCLLAFTPENGHNYLCQWVFAAPPLSPVLKTIIDLSVKRILDMEVIKGEHIIHYLTGPSLFSDGVDEYCKSANMYLPPNRLMYVGYPGKLYAFEPSYFHAHQVQHLFSGDEEDGWKKERLEILC